MRTVKELEKIIDEKGIYKFDLYGKKLSKSELINRLARDIWYAEHKTTIDFPEQIKPMFGKEGSYENLQEYEDSGEWLMELKLNGCRGIMHIRKPNDVVVTSRNQSVKTFRYEEKQKNVKHLLQESDFSTFEDTILDGELTMDVDRIDTGSVITATKLQAVTAILSRSMEKAEELQVQFGKIKYMVFDLLRVGGHDLRNEPFSVRRNLLKTVVVSLGNPFIKLVPQFNRNFIENFNKVIDKGDEGVMVKHIDGLYKQRGNSKEMLKIKRAIYLDAYVDGYVMANEKSGFAGLVGSFIMKAKNEDETITVGQIINVPFEERKYIRQKYESIYKYRVAEIRGQDWTKNGRLSHCELMGWRDDKSMDETQISEVHIKRRRAIMAIAMPKSCYISIRKGGEE